MDSISEQRLAQVYPALADKIRQIEAQMQQEDLPAIRVTQAVRTIEEQDALYQKGRTTPGAPCNHGGKVWPVGTCSLHPLGAHVTNCPGGDSYHNFGLAVDCVPSVPGDTYIPDWNPEHSTWKRMEAIGQQFGLTVGAYWRSFPDAPHFQLTGRFPVGAPDDELRGIFQGGGLEAVFAAVSQG